MLQPDKNVKNLLYDNDCVIIPGFGGFIKRNNPTILDKKTGVIKPQGQSVFFNGALTQNDGLVVGNIATEKNILYNEAIQLVSKWVAESEKELSLNGRLKFGILGTFFVSNEGKKWFAPNTAINFSKKTFGLESIIAKTILNEEVEIETNTSQKEITISKPIARKSRLGFKIAASVLILAFAGTALWYFQIIDFTGKNTNFQNAQILSLEDTFTPKLEEPKEELPVLEVEDDPDSIFSDVVEGELTIEEPVFNTGNSFEEQFPESPIEENEYLEEPGLTILAGAFLYENNADRRIAFLREKGFEIHSVKPEHSRLMRIQCGRFYTKEDAKLVLQTIKEFIPEAHITELKK